MFKTKDVDAFINQLQEGCYKVQENAINAIKDSLKLVEVTSQSYVPIKTGDLTESFFTEIKYSDKKIVGIAGYDKEGRLDYAKVMHSGYWPTTGWPDIPEYLWGQPISYNPQYQPTPKSKFLLLGFTENRIEIYELMRDIFNGL